MESLPDRRPDIQLYPKLESHLTAATDPRSIVAINGTPFWPILMHQTRVSWAFIEIQVETTRLL